MMNIIPGVYDLAYKFAAVLGIGLLIGAERERWLGMDRYSDANERNNLMKEIQYLGLLASNFVPNDRTEGKNLSRRLEELDEQEFSRLLEVLSHYCGAVGIAAGT